MASLEEQFEQAFTEIKVPGGPHLLEAEAVTDCEVNGSQATVTLNLPKDASTWESAGSYLFPALALILTGPGAFSIDSLLFGRRNYDASARSVTPPVKRRG